MLHVSNIHSQQQNGHKYVKTLPDRIRAVLKHFDLKQTGLSSLVGMKHTVVIKWLSGETAMPQSTAMAFQAALGVRWEWLLHGQGRMMLDDMGKLSTDEVRLLQVFRHSDMTARKEILDQAEFQLGRSKRRGDTK